MVTALAPEVASTEPQVAERTPDGVSSGINEPTIKKESESAMEPTSTEPPQTKPTESSPSSSENNGSESTGESGVNTSDSINNTSSTTVSASNSNSGPNLAAPANEAPPVKPLTGPLGAFRRARSTRACEVCHARKVRCDAMVHMPCTNCVAFGCECRIPEVKRRKISKKNDKPKSSVDSAVRTENSRINNNGTNGIINTKPILRTNETTNLKNVGNLNNTNSITADTNLKTNENQPQSSNQQSATSGSSGSSATYLGSSSNFGLLVEPTQDTQNHHFPVPEILRNVLSSAKGSAFDSVEIEILKLRGAFLLPPRALCDDLIDCYFEHVNTLIPIVNRTQFMRRYNDPTNPPSLFLLQAVLLAGSRVCKNPALLDASGSADLASITFYKRAKALFDANYESDKITIVQALILMGWYWEGPEDVTKNVFYWTRVGLTVAQGFGLHRSVADSRLSEIEKRLWKRVFWVAFVRDRSVAVAFGRPVVLDLDDCDVPMIEPEDFNEDEPGLPSPYRPDAQSVAFFINNVKLSEIMGLVLRQQYSAGTENLRAPSRIPIISHCDIAMGTWMANLPPELKYSVKDRSQHSFFPALIHAQYYTILCLVHRSNILFRRRRRQPADAAYPSWGIAFQAAHMIAMIMDNLMAADQLQYCPAFIVYMLFSAMIMFVYQLESPSRQVAETARSSLDICSRALREVSSTWMVGKMILKMFETILKDNRARRRLVKNMVNQESGEEGKEGKEGQEKEGQEGQQAGQTAGQTAGQSVKHPTGQSTEQPVAQTETRPVNPVSVDSTSTKSVPSAPSNPTKISQPPSVAPSTTASAFPSPHPEPQMASPGTHPELFFFTNTIPSSEFSQSFEPSRLFAEELDIGRLSGLQGTPIEPSPASHSSHSDPSANLGETGTETGTTFAEQYFDRLLYQPPSGIASEVELDPSALNSQAHFSQLQAGVRSTRGPQFTPVDSNGINGMNGVNGVNGIGTGTGSPGMPMNPPPQGSYPSVGSVGQSGVTNSDEIPSSLNIGDWYNFIY